VDFLGEAYGARSTAVRPWPTSRMVLVVVVLLGLYVLVTMV